MLIRKHMEVCVEAVLLELRLGWPLCIRKTQFPLYLVEGQKDGKKRWETYFLRNQAFLSSMCSLKEPLFLWEASYKNKSSWRKALSVLTVLRSQQMTSQVALVGTHAVMVTCAVLWLDSWEISRNSTFSVNFIMISEKNTAFGVSGHFCLPVRSIGKRCHTEVSNSQ